MERGAKPAKAKVEARPAVTGKSRKIGDATGPQLKRRLADALEQHAAISEILQVISTSPSDVQPVLDAVAERVARLCEAPLARVLLVDGDALRAMAEYSLDGTSQARTVPLPLKRTTVVGRAVLDRATIHHDDVVPLLDSEYPDALNARPLGLRAVLAVPLMREGNAHGVILLWRREPGLFSSDQVALAETFAQQVAIAIHNVRLFKETKEALEQQTAISEILRVIANSPGDVRPMLNVVAERAMYLCDAADATIFLREGDRLRSAARFGSTPTPLDEGKFMPLTRGSVTGRAVIDRSVFHMEDLATASQEEFPVGRELQRQLGHHAALSVPLMREDRAIGAIALWRMEARRFTDKQIALVKTFADQAAIAIENVRLFDEVEARTRELSESLQQQTATADVLKVISRSAFDLQRVLDTLTESVCKLCDAEGANIWRPDGDGFKVAALFGQPAAQKAALRERVIKPGKSTCVGRALLERRTVHIPNTNADPEYTAPNVAGNRAMVGVPLLREGVPIGVLVLTRRKARHFTEKQIALATTFADQAVIAIENVRLFNETQEALERQTATSEILRVISRSPTDVQPVFDAIAAAALKLCNASSTAVLTFDGELMRLGALANVSPAEADVLRRRYPKPPGRETAGSRAILTGSTVVVPDVLEDPEFEARGRSFRSVVSVPLLREKNPIGAITVGRPEPGRFPDTQIALLKTFADQAVIAIENVRLFTELTQKNRALTQAHAQVSEALERQTATSDVLRIISSSPTDVQPVFETIVASAARLCSAESAAVYRFDGEIVDFVAGYHFSPEALEAYHRRFPRPLRDTDHVQRVLDGSVLNISDIEKDPYTTSGSGDVHRARGVHSTVIVPMLREDRVIGAIGVSHRDVGAFTNERVELLKTFADQAVIAIENVRLFTELEARTRQLTRSVGELQALGEVGQVVSSTLDLETVLSTIVSRATALAGMDAGAIYEYDEVRGEFYLHTADRLPEEVVTALRAGPIAKGEGALGRMAMTGDPTQIHDIMTDASYQSRLRGIILRLGYRSLTAVPLLRDDHLLGGLVVYRKTPGEFDASVIDLLKTFATQSALAIQNARLFREVENKSRELETASRHKSEFLANMSHELRTPLNAIIGFSEVLSERMFGEINEKQAEYLDDILESGRHLLSLINDILDLSKIEAGRMELEATDFDLPSAIESTLMLVRERAHRRGITLARNIDERLAMIRGDERKVKQVLLNLLSNALKFTPEGGQIGVQAELRDGAAEISVTDTGVGIAPEDQETVFEEFRQVGMASKKVEGTGLGLAISRKFIELHSGKIWVKSQVGAGSTFAFTLPLQ